MVIAGLGVCVIAGILYLIWPRKFAPIGASGSQSKGVLSKIQKYDLFNDYFASRRLQWLALLMGINAGLFGWWSSTIIANAWGGPPIEIVSATYASNCAGAVPGAVHERNVTAEAQKECLYNQCTLSVAAVNSGDSAPECAKDFSVAYQCKRDPRLRTASITGDAAGKSIDLDCYAPPPFGINILTATYGRSCSAFVAKTQALNWVREGNVTKFVDGACDLSQNSAGNRCKVAVDPATWGDPAQGCGKDFSVSYQCKGEQEPRTASLPAEAAGKSVELDCASPPLAIRIVSATYGASCTGFVPSGQATNWAREGNVTDRVYEACNIGIDATGDRCKFTIDVNHWGDPAQGCGKDFSVSYQCKGDRQPRMASIAAEAAGKSVELDCGAPVSALRIVSATYGQSCSGFVPTSQAQNWVREGNVTERVREDCSSKNAADNRCTFLVDNNRWGDPAQGCGKDFSVSYQCKGDQRMRTASIAAEAAGKSVELDCAPPLALRILSATYGQSCSGFVPTTQSQNWVREGNVTERVYEACSTGQNAKGDRCKFIVDNNRWGDPAQGCGKDFSVSYQCKDEQQPRTASVAAEAAGKRVVLDCNAVRR
jgi:hypothetical protein